MADIFSTLSGTVIFLLAGTPPVPIGTAFVVGYPDPENDSYSIPLIVTAKHLVDERDKVIGRFSTNEGKTLIDVHYNLSKIRANKDYWVHPDPNVDIAVFRTKHFEETDYLPLPINLIATKETFVSEEIVQTNRIFFPSLLVNFMGSTRNYPVIRSGEIALIPNEPVPIRYKSSGKIIKIDQEAILVEATAIPGSSGSPVFLWPGPRIKGNSIHQKPTKAFLLGIMFGFYNYDIQENSLENSGIAIVIPSWRLREILDLKQLRDRIIEVIAKEQKHNKE